MRRARNGEQGVRKKNAARRPRPRLTQTALKLLFEKDFANLTIQQVAGSIGVSRGAPVHHYATGEP